MEIVVLDGYTLNPGDMTWDALKGLGNVTVYDRTDAAQTVSRIGDATVALTNKVIIDREVMTVCKGLKYIGVLATGYNVVDVDAAHELGIIVTNIPAYSTASVAQMVFAHILNVTNSVAQYAAEVAAGKWTACTDFCYWNTPSVELAGKNMAIVGLGNIGKAVARIAQSFGMKVIAVTSKPQNELPNGVESVTLDEAFAQADVLSLHCPLTATTRDMVNAATLAKMKPSAIVINTGRGPLVNEQDMADALKNGVIAAYGTDVLTVEPARADNLLLSAPRCHITPHIGWASTEARHRLMSIAVENVRQFIAGENVINKV